MRVRVRLLGPVDVLAGGAVRPVTGLRRKAVLAALALHPGRVVAVDRLVELVWGEAPPASAVVTLQSHVSHLRRVLGDAGLVAARPPGYVLNVAEPVSDVQLVEGVLRETGRTGEPAATAARLREAVALWRGQPLADLAELPWFAGQAQRLEQLLAEVRHRLVEARLALGEHVALVTDLQELVEQRQLDEHAHRQLMLALYRTGRQADALAVYQRLYRRLDEQLGVAPGPALREVHSAILRHDSSLDLPAPAGGSGAAAPAPVTPAQLPPAVARFTGRAEELAELDALVVDRPAGMAIAIVSGTAGVGKTSLALHWAHRAAGRFPDGQLYANLRGYDRGGRAAEPADVLRGFLEALGVAAERIPGDLDARTALYRSLVAGRRFLVLLDNARTAAQVRPLLPSTPGCRVVITSRNRLAGLAASDGAVPVAVDLLSAAASRDLLAARLGARRVAEEPAAVEEIAVRCAHLPLALAVVAARAAANPGFGLAAIAAELRAVATGLDAFQVDDAATDVRTVFSWSYRTLSPAAARLFRLLGLHAGPDISAPAAASLAAVPVGQGRRLLGELTQAHLVTERAPGRYAGHDLLVAYAAELADRFDPAEDRHEAIHRFLDHHLHSARSARVALNPEWRPIPLPPARPGVSPEQLDSNVAALAWFTAEYPVVRAAIERAAALGFDRHVWQLAWALRIFAHRRGRWREQLADDQTALAAARRLADPVGEAHTVYGLGWSYVKVRRLDTAVAKFQRALELFTELGDRAGQVDARLNLSDAAQLQGQTRPAIAQAELGLELTADAGMRAARARALGSLGWHHVLLGNYQQAAGYCTQALALLQELGDRPSEAGAWDTLGLAHRGLTNYQRSIACHQRAIDMFREVGDRYFEADCLASLGDSQCAAGDLAGARTSWRSALEILRQLDHPDAQAVHARLAAQQPETAAA